MSYSNKERGMALYTFLKCSSGNTAIKCIMADEYKLPWSKCFIKIPFLAILALYSKKKRCDQVDPPHVTPNIRLCMHTKFYACSSIIFSGKNTIFGFFSPMGGVLLQSSANLTQTTPQCLPSSSEISHQ